MIKRYNELLSYNSSSCTTTKKIRNFSHDEIFQSIFLIEKSVFSFYSVFNQCDYFSSKADSEMLEAECGKTVLGRVDFLLFAV